MGRTLLKDESATADIDGSRVVDSIHSGGRSRIVYLSIALALGIWISHSIDQPFAWPWIVLACTTIILLGFAHFCGRSRFVFPLLMISMASIGAAWYSVQHHRLASNDIATLAREEPTILRLTGLAMRDAELRRPTSGSMSNFDYRLPVTYFPMRVDGFVNSDGERQPATGNAFVRVEQTIPPLRAGDRVTVFGSLRSPGRPRNPGEFDFAEYARSLGQAGIISVPRRELVEITPTSRTAIFETFIGWRQQLRDNANRWLLSDLPAADARQDALLAALLLGQREPDLDDINESFKRTGLAHLLAISGMHLGVVVLGVLALARMLAVRERWHGIILIGIALAYLFLIEVRMPVLRAAVMVIAGGLALSLGRRVRVKGAIAIAGIALLLWRPDQLFTPGFQLSFGVVLALALLAPIVRERWFGLKNNNPVSVGAMIQEWFKTTLAAAVVAWIVATPIIAYHFAFVCPLAAPLSVIAIPLTAVILLVGYAKITVSALLPSLALLVAAPLSFAAHVLLALVTIIDDLPGATVSIPFPSSFWAFAAIVWSCAWCRFGLWDKQLARIRRPMTATLILLLIWLYWPRLMPHSAAALQLDVLAVGDGSCYILQSGGETMVFDAGSQNLNVGERTIVPAMRRMNITYVDVIAISHANLDHFSAVIEVVDAFDVREVLVTPVFERAVARDLNSSAAHLMKLLAERNVSVRAVSAGSKRSLGGATITWLHPPDQDFERVNDTSMVLRVDCAGRSILLTGDIQQEAIELLLREHSDELRVDVTEMPHHGSYNDASIAFMAQIQPAVAIQSCGWSRLERDQWDMHLAGVDRLITARDGACHVEIADDGMISVARFLENP